MRAALEYDQSGEKAKRSIRRALARSIGRWRQPQLLYDEVLLAQAIDAKETIRPLIKLVDANNIPDKRPDVKTLAVGFIVEYSKNKRVLGTLRRWFDRPTFGNRYKGWVFAGIIAAEPDMFAARFKSFLDMFNTDDDMPVEHVFDRIIRSVGKQKYLEVIEGLSKKDKEQYLGICDTYRIGGFLRDLTCEKSLNGSVHQDANGGTVYQYEPSFFEATTSGFPEP